MAGEIVADYFCKLFHEVDLDDTPPNSDDEDYDSPEAPNTLDLSTGGLMQASYMDVNKSDGFQIAKMDEDECLVFGWASVSAGVAGDLLVDHHDDIIEPAELEKAAYEYVLKFRGAGEMHQGEAVGQLVESLVMTPEKAQAMGIQHPMATAWWCGFKVSPDTFQKVKDGTYKMFSIQGTAERDGS